MAREFNEKEMRNQRPHATGNIPISSSFHCVSHVSSGKDIEDITRFISENGYKKMYTIQLSDCPKGRLESSQTDFVEKSSTGTTD